MEERDFLLENIVFKFRQLLILLNCEMLSFFDIALLVGSRGVQYSLLSNSTKTLKAEIHQELSNFNFQWTKTLYQNNLNNIAFILTFFKG